MSLELSLELSLGMSLGVSLRGSIEPNPRARPEQSLGLSLEPSRLLIPAPRGGPPPGSRHTSACEQFPRKGVST